MSKTIVIGHRGACALLPENTMESFRLAFDEGAPMIEFDVHLSKDGVPVIIHDATLPRTTNGTGYISTFTAKELKHWDAGAKFSWRDTKKEKLEIPTFEEILVEFKMQQLAVEIKENSAEITHAVMKLIRQYGAEERCIVGSKYHVVSKTMRNHYPEMRRFLSKREFVLHYLAYKAHTPDLTPDPQAVASMPLEACGLAFGNQDFIEYLHARKITVFFWTINNPLVMKELAKRGADGIITDHPGLGIQTLLGKK